MQWLYAKEQGKHKDIILAEEMEALKAYLKAIKDLSPSDTEHSKRTFLEQFLGTLKDGLNQSNVIIKHEPARAKSGEGAPDFVFLRKGLSFGYVENKRINADLDALVQSAQIKKYFRLSANIILTDYLRFCLLRKNNNTISIVRDVRIC